MKGFKIVLTARDLNSITFCILFFKVPKKIILKQYFISKMFIFDFHFSESIIRIKYKNV